MKTARTLFFIMAAVAVTDDRAYAYCDTKADNCYGNWSTVDFNLKEQAMDIIRTAREKVMASQGLDIQQAQKKDERTMGATGATELDDQLNTGPIAEMDDLPFDLFRDNTISTLMFETADNTPQELFRTTVRARYTFGIANEFLAYTAREAADAQTRFMTAWQDMMENYSASKNVPEDLNVKVETEAITAAIREISHMLELTSGVYRSVEEAYFTRNYTTTGGRIIQVVETNFVTG